MSLLPSHFFLRVLPGYRIDAVLHIPEAHCEKGDRHRFQCSAVLAHGENRKIRTLQKRIVVQIPENVDAHQAEHCQNDEPYPFAKAVSGAPKNADSEDQNDGIQNNMENVYQRVLENGNHGVS